MVAAPLVDVSSWHLSFPAAPLRSPMPAAIPDAIVALMDRAYAQASGREVDSRDLAFGVASRMLFELTASGAQKLMNGTLDDRIRLLYSIRLDKAAELLQRASVLPTLAAAMTTISKKARGGANELPVLAPYPAFRR